MFFIPKHDMIKKNCNESHSVRQTEVTHAILHVEKQWKISFPSTANKELTFLI